MINKTATNHFPNDYHKTPNADQVDDRPCETDGKMQIVTDQQDDGSIITTTFVCEDANPTVHNDLRWRILFQK